MDVWLAIQVTQLPTQPGVYQFSIDQWMPLFSEVHFVLLVAPESAKAEPSATVPFQVPCSAFPLISLGRSEVPLIIIIGLVCLKLYLSITFTLLFHLMGRTGTD